MSVVAVEIEPLDCTPAAEEAADILHAVVMEMMDRGYEIADLIEAAEMNIEAMRLSTQEARH